MADTTAVVQGPRDLFSLGGEEIKEQNRTLTMARCAFTGQIENAVSKKDPGARSKEEKLNALNEILETDKSWLQDPTMCMQLFSAYRDLGQADKMMEVYKKARSVAFRKSPMVHEQLAGALSREAAKGGKMADAYRKSAVKMCEKLIQNEEASSVSYGVLAQCLAQEGKTEEAKKVLDDGFRKTLDPFIGLQAVQANLETGKKEDKKYAKELAKIVYLSALRDGAEESTDFYTLSAALQTACIAGEKPETINHFVDRIAKSVEYPWELDELKRNMASLKDAGINPKIVQEVQSKLDAMELKQEEKNGGNAVVIGAKDDRTFGDDPKLSALRAHSYNYRGCGTDFRGVTRVGGNMEFGGQLPSHTVSPKDLELFTGLINKTPEELGMTAEDLAGIKGISAHQKLADIKDPELFIRVVDKFVRKTFMTENYAGSGLHLEDNALAKGSDGKSFYDRTVIGVEETCGKTTRGATPDEKAFVDTRTNIAAIFALGMGDCRHHAQVKQIMFDMYQRQQMNASLNGLLEELDSGKELDIQKGEKAKEFYDVLDTELRTADVSIMMPVQMNQAIKIDGEWEDVPDGTPGASDATYKPKLKDGKLITDPAFDKGEYEAKKGSGDPDHLHCLEEHTFCWLIKKNREGEMVECGLRDAFYQSEERLYQWAHKDFSADDIHVSKDGKLEISIGDVSGDHTASGEAIPVFLRPTSYNKGKRDQKVTSSTGKDICCVGIEVKGFETTDSFLEMILDPNKTEMLHVMSAEGKAVCSEQDASFSKDKAQKAQTNGDTDRATQQLAFSLRRGNDAVVDRNAAEALRNKTLKAQKARVLETNDKEKTSNIPHDSGRKNIDSNVLKDFKGNGR
ncbi:MAG: hypothetical protein J5787_02155 [Alphaproteobacteria bacterium]|nr:hypothetical protein [Alphaproteobacteria bacterium]